MAKVPVTISIRQEDLLQLDAFAGERRLTRGDAVGMLLEAHAGILGGIRLDDPDYVPPPPNRTKLDRGRKAMARATETEPALEEVPEAVGKAVDRLMQAEPLRDESEHAMLCRNPDLERRLREAREAQERALAGDNAGAFDVAPEPTPQILKRRDPYSQVEEWDSDGVAQDPPQDDVDQRAKRRGK